MTTASRLLVIAVIAASGAPAAAPTGVVPVLEAELSRNFAALKEKADPPPYYLSYAVDERETNTISATLGALSATDRSHGRRLSVSIRVGSPELDNYHRTGRERAQYSSLVAVPVDNGAPALRRAAWLETDRLYRLASQRLIQIKTNQQVQVSREDDSPDFSQEPPAQFRSTAPAFKFNEAEWAARVRKISERFQKYPDALSTIVTLLVQRETKYLVTSEGTRIETGRNFAEILIIARGKASDGMDLAVHQTVEADEPSHLPKDDAILALVDQCGRDLTGLLKAPIVEPYVGPAILSGRATGVFFHEIFGHRIEGHRQKDDAEGQTFTKSVGQPVLPAFLSVVFDPTRKKFDSVYLNGNYDYDDEGVKSRPVTVVDHGILKTFLMSRAPIKGIPHSNGHGRRQIGADAVSRQSNLLVESANAVSDDRLREMLRDELKRQNKPWGLYFEQVTGGYTTTQRAGLQAFTVIPLVVYRVFADRRPDELVRGVDIVGTPLASFAKIAATSNRMEVFNGICGAESGSVPVSATAPAVLVTEIEIQKKEHQQDRPPLLPRPEGEGR